VKRSKVHADMRSLKNALPPSGCEGCLSENGADCITTSELAVKVFCAGLIYSRIEQYFRGVYTSNILEEMPGVE
jgi:hypothetical protein